MYQSFFTFDVNILFCEARPIPRSSLFSIPICVNALKTSPEA
ncbi:predicted protein [Plenodomus lingam JN3]|uniref:Predicted protein n=1 Tax=Leptosphaeria maculans (strain JN3 / isolate v23.1.3 / race Av1-4-5-6-7-8) TaxID=985895 RepID=E5A5H4_LEPMJ|nr:predicted protein [Plenodomus lingam JN3]CBX98872.1 predicted protein [Plenodomus lingam JN3]